MQIRSCLVALTTSSVLAVSASCAFPGGSDVTSPPQHSTGHRHPSHAARTSGQPTAPGTASSRPTPTADVPTTVPSGGSPSGDEPAALLYFAHGQVHDGDQRVSYAADGIVSYLVRTETGWAMKENAPHVGGRLVLLGADAAVIGTYPFGSVGHRLFDVSDDGTTMAHIPLRGRTVRIVDTATGGLVERVSPPLGWLSSVRFSGRNLLISGGGSRTLLWEPDSGSFTELPYTRDGRIGIVGDVSADGQIALVDDSIRRGAIPCVSAWPVDAGARPRWQACGVTAYEGALSTDGGLVITVAGRNKDGTFTRTDGLGISPPSFQVTDTRTGQVVASIDPSGLLLDATWAGDGNLLVNTTTDRHFTAFHVYECTMAAACQLVTTEPHDPGLGRIR